IPVLTPSATKLAVGDTVNIQFATGPALTNDWVGIYKMGQTPGAASPAVAWQHVTAASGTVPFEKLAKGFYFAGYFLKDGYFEPGARTFFQVGDTIASVSSTGSSFTKGSPVTIYFSDGPATAKDYVGIFPKGATPGVTKLTDYLYVGGKASGSVT